jgi:dCMP deaminase
MINRISFEEMYMRMAEAVASRSSATKRKVGAIAVHDDGSIISIGYNGTPAETCNICEDPETNKTYPWVIHAEDNLIRKNKDLFDSTVYITLAPCSDCAIILLRAGVKRVYYREWYKNNNGIDLLDLWGIPVGQLQRMTDVSQESKPLTLWEKIRIHLGRL